MITLGETIQILESLSPERRKLIVPCGFHAPHSWRGIYAELAFSSIDKISIQQMLETAQSAVGSVYTGWKGGDYEMNPSTRVHLSMIGHADDESGAEFEKLLYQVLRYGITHAQLLQ